MESTQSPVNTAKFTAPKLPTLLSLPFRMAPKPLQFKSIELFLTQIFKTELVEQRLDFLTDRHITINISDAFIHFGLSLKQNKIQVFTPINEPDLTLTTDCYTLLQLISQQADADGLFFNRRLDSQGDTELGLYVKNFLASLDPDESKILYLSKRMSSRLLHLINIKHNIKQ